MEIYFQNTWVSNEQNQWITGTIFLCSLISKQMYLFPWLPGCHRGTDKKICNLTSFFNVFTWILCGCVCAVLTAATRYIFSIYSVNPYLLKTNLFFIWKVYLTERRRDKERGFPLKMICLCFIFRSLTMMCYCEDIFWTWLFWFLGISCVWMPISVSKSEKLPAIISLKRFPKPFLLLNP